MQKIKPIAIYLPQFHPTPENDAWWGKGFTEWTNVTKAKPRFDGHYQPHLPADLGFYDLRLEEARLAQEAMAKEYGIYGFCYYHYWFNGKRLLHEPLDRKLQNPKEDFPFMLCWANENWSRAWDGSENQVLLKQEYNADDDRAHIQHLLTYFKDDRYIKVDGKPIFAFYKPDLFPNMKQTIQIFREEAKKENLELYLTWFERWIGWEDINFTEIGFDAAIEFQPLSKSLKQYLSQKNDIKYEIKLINNRIYVPNFIKKISKKILRKLFKKSLVKPIKKLERLISYENFVDFDLKREKVNYKIYPGVCPMWDNSSRRVNQEATIFVDSTPEAFKKWYQGKIDKFEPFSNSENFIFINAWNEWAEGNHLEPCQKWGTKYLQSLKL
ncbi:MAG: glycoside hydrolase family 99-like domain-containing protein [Flavobacterium sp.]